MSKVLEAARELTPPGWGVNCPLRSYMSPRKVADDGLWDNIVFCCVKCRDEIAHSMYCQCDLDIIEEYRQKQIVLHPEGEHHIYKYRGTENGHCTPWHSFMVCDCGLGYYDNQFGSGGLWVPHQGLWLSNIRTYPMDDELDYTGHPLYS